MMHRRTTRAGAVLFTLVLVAGCGDSPSVPELLGHVEPITELPRTLSVPEKTVIQGNNRFGLRLLRQVASVGAPGENVILSPLSASMALGMTLEGAEGNTFDEMRDVLGFEDLSHEEIATVYHDLLKLLYDLDPTVRFRSSNSLWHRNGFEVESAFREVVRRHFEADVEGLDFSIPEAPRTINDWVSQETEGRIGRILEGPIDPATVMFLINAIYFKGAWTHAFEADRTAQADFTLSDGSTVRVPMMATSDDTPMRASVGGSPNNYKVVELPFGGQAFAMTLVLPPFTGDLRSFVASLDQERWEEILGSMRDTRAGVFLPRFQLGDDTELKAALRTLGMHDAFDPERADFSRMHRRARDMQVHASGVRQGTWLSVDEQGTEVVTHTGFPVQAGIGPDLFHFDRPFLFAIRERLSGTLVFVGLVENPDPDG